MKKKVLEIREKFGKRIENEAKERRETDNQIRVFIETTKRMLIESVNQKV